MGLPTHPKTAFNPKFMVHYALNPTFHVPGKHWKGPGFCWKIASTLEKGGLQWFMGFGFKLTGPGLRIKGFGLWARFQG